jgi:hypothetical protein
MRSSCLLLLLPLHSLPRQARLPLDLRTKKTRCLRRALSKEQVRGGPVCAVAVVWVHIVLLLYECT